MSVISDSNAPTNGDAVDKTRTAEVKRDAPTAPQPSHHTFPLVIHVGTEQSPPGVPVTLYADGTWSGDRPWVIAELAKLAGKKDFLSWLLLAAMRNDNERVR